MTRQEMRKKLWLKVKINYKAYLLFLLVTIIFTVLAVINCIHVENEDLSSVAITIFVVFLYWALTIHSAICILERSKINYLVPRSEDDIKQFIHYQCRVKCILILIVTGVFFVVFYLIRPEAITIIRNSALIGGVCMGIFVSYSSLDSYYIDGKKHKKYGSVYYTFVIIFGVILGMGLTSGTIYLARNKLYFVWNIISAVAVLVSVIYVGIRVRRFGKMHPCYEDITVCDGRLYKAGKQLMS